MNKHEIAEVLDTMGTLLALKGDNPFEIRAYHNAARVIENLDENLEKLVLDNSLEKIPGIGQRLAKKITILITTGRLPAFEKLKKSIPAPLLQLLKIPGLGSKKVKALYEKLHIRSIEDLLRACKGGKVARLAGFGEKSQANIMNGIAKMESYGKRMLWWDAKHIADSLTEAFSTCKQVKKVEVAGSLRRGLETVGDLDILAISTKPLQVMEWFIKQPFIKKVLARGPTKASVRLKDEIQVDLRILPENEFGFGLLYFTGSKEHNIRLRIRARERGYMLSEYRLDPIQKKERPLFSKKEAPSEKEIYRALGLCYIPPELREDMGEIEAAEKGKIPRLIEEKDLMGAFHCHTAESDGHNRLEEMVSSAENLGWKYIGISDHSKSSFQANGLAPDALIAQMQRIARLNRSKKFSTYIFSGTECDILKDGRLDFPNEILKKLDFVIISIHSSFQLDEAAMTKRLIKAIENPYSTIVGHLTARLLLERDPIAMNHEKVIDACIANGKIIELNGHPMRLDMDWRLWHKARDKGLKTLIDPDAHSVKDLEFVRSGVKVARKGWLRKQDVLNTLSLKAMKAFLEKQKK